tara:strand:+ start:653 stop:1201 length:549 start_codon:yes stop_codon:yes gene_type:complete
MIQDLKSVARLSSRNNWEYAGKLDVGPDLVYKGITHHTSKKKNLVERVALEGPVGYHTHPCTLEGFHATLPSDADLSVYIHGYPTLWTNLLCDRDGFYEIKLTDRYALPVPHRVHATMLTLRSEPFLMKHRVSDDGVEFYETTQEEWSRFVEDDLHTRLYDLFGISVTYNSFMDPKSSLRSS